MSDLKEILSFEKHIAWSIFDTFGDHITLVDSKGLVLFANETASQEYAKPDNEIINTLVWELYSDTNISHFQILFTQVVETGEPISVTHKIKDHWKRTLIYPIRGKELPVEVVAICSRDITLQVNAEEQLKRVLLELITAQENERHRISQDLHDDVGQRMTALVFELKSIKDALLAGQSVTADEMNTIIRNVETILKHIRQIFYQLHPPSLSKMALPRVLEAFCSSFEESHGLKVDFSNQEDFPELPNNYNIAIYRFIQEGLTNVFKHAQATAAWINLDYTEDDINVSLEDNGNGFEPKLIVEGIGLHGIRERFLILNGNIDIESSPGKGTRLSGTIPFNK